MQITSMWYELNWATKVVGFLWWFNILFLICFFILRRKRFFINFIYKRNNILVCSKIIIFNLLIVFNFIDYYVYNHSLEPTIPFGGERYKISILEFLLLIIFCLIVPAINLFLIMKIKKKNKPVSSP